MINDLKTEEHNKPVFVLNTAILEILTTASDVIDGFGIMVSYEFDEQLQGYRIQMAGDSFYLMFEAGKKNPVIKKGKYPVSCIEEISENIMAFHDHIRQDLGIASKDNVIDFNSYKNRKK